MSDNVSKVSDWAQANTLGPTDRVLVLANTTSNASNRTITVSNFANTLITSSAPAQANSPGRQGQVAYDSTHIYVCVSSNNWVRATLASW